MAVSQGKLSASIAHSIYKKESVVTGHHIYKKFWKPVIEEVLSVERELDNQHYDFVTKSGDIVSHVLRSSSHQ